MKYGLIGDPIGTSLSPVLFKAAYNGEMQYDLIEGADFEASWKRFLDDYQAINVTAPFKEKAFRKADIISGPCAKIGATNLIVKTPDGLVAHNSDFTGIILSIADAYFPGLLLEFYARFGAQAHIKIHQFCRQAIQQLFAQTPQALIVGCGGAGRAAAVAAAELGFDTALMNRTPEKAEALRNELPEYNFINVPITDFKASLKECDLIIYTLPMALPEITELTTEDFAGEDRYSSSRPSKVILEANYKTPAFAPTGTGTESETSKKMTAAGCQYAGGRKWLTYQALTGYSVMTGKQPDLQSLLQAI